MLRELRVRNLAVIETATVRFAAGLNVLSGETGAGKSILVDAVLLLRGGRAQADVIRAEAEAALIEGLFEVEPGSVTGQILSDAGLSAADGQIMVRRELARSGRHRAFVNDSPVTVALLERVGDSLLEVHGQHEHQGLLQTAQQLNLLDRFAGTEEHAARVGALYSKQRAARQELDGTRSAERDRVQREDLLRFQVRELDAAHLRLGEEDALRVERRRLQSAERLLSGLTEVEGQLDDDRDSVLTRIARAARGLRDLGRLDPELAAPADTVDSARVLLEEALRTLRALRAATVEEPGRLEAIEERLDVLTRLKRKYGDSEATMLAFRDAAAQELERLARHDEIVVEQERLLSQVEMELEAVATELSGRRDAAAARLQTLVEREIRLLGMARAVFQVTLERASLATVTPRGWDRVEFRLSANPGEAPKTLARAASGGELSRVMLAVRTVLAAADEVPTVIFDEVDAGIGGQTAGVVGDRLAKVAARRQVLCVTHLAQIAARASHHVRVSKHVQGGRSRARVEVLAGEARVAEIARMLGAETKAALRHARELLGDT